MYYGSLPIHLLSALAEKMGLDCDFITTVWYSTPWYIVRKCFMHRKNYIITCKNSVISIFYVVWGFDYYQKIHFFGCDQAALGTFQFVRPSVRLSQFFTMFPSSYHHESFRSYCHRHDRSDVHAKDQGQRSKSQRSNQVLPQFGRFRTVTPVSIHRSNITRCWAQYEEK